MLFELLVWSVFGGKNAGRSGAKKQGAVIMMPVVSDSNEKVSGWIVGLVVGLIPWLVYLLLDYYGFVAWMEEGNTAVSVAFAVWKWLAIAEMVVSGILASVKVYCYIRKREDTAAKEACSLNDAFGVGFAQLFLCLLAVLFLTHWGWFVGFVLLIMAGFGGAADD